MLPLVYISPSCARYSVTPDEYAAAKSRLQKDSRISHLVNNQDGGSATVEGVDFSWRYDGVSSLEVTIIKKHGIFVREYPDSAIFEDLGRELLS